MNDSDKRYDLLIIGGGPAGLSAAIYAGREDLATLVVDKDPILGGLAAITDRIDNYPGFPDGVSGVELAERLEQQAKRFGAELRTGIEVTKLSGGSPLEVETNQGQLRAKAVLITTGSTYRHLGVPGEAEQIGRSVHFCATCDGPLYKGRDLVVVGGGNSAVQETLFLARFARQITILVRGPEFKASAVLIDDLAKLDNVTVVYNTPVTALESKEGRFQAALSGDKRFTADGMFVFIGLLANTQAFVHALDHDEANFIKTKPNYATNLPGVFVAGDVRSGSTWQIASAVGEGVSAALAVREYLDRLTKSL